MSSEVLMPRDMKEMAMLVLSDRRIQGYTQDEMLELRDWMREAAETNMDDLRAYLEREVKPIRERKAMVDAAVLRIKERIEREAKEQERKAA